MQLPDFSEEKTLWESGYNLVIGVDEVGRGCFAGPIVASAVAFPVCHPESGRTKDLKILRFTQNDNWITIDDSKRLKPNERKKSAGWIKDNCLAYGIGEIEVSVINKVGIGKATAMAMRRAIQQIITNFKYQMSPISNSLEIRNLKLEIPKRKIFVLADAFYIRHLRGIGIKNQKAIVKGDQKSISIAAASIVAKVYRDRLMQKLAKQYPLYGWGRNKGYGTAHHQEAILANGITRLHRKVFVESFLLG